MRAQVFFPETPNSYWTVAVYVPHSGECIVPPLSLHVLFEEI